MYHSCEPTDADIVAMLITHSIRAGTWIPDKLVEYKNVLTSQAQLVEHSPSMPEARGPGFKSPLGQRFFHMNILGWVGCLSTVHMFLMFWCMKVSFPTFIFRRINFPRFPVKRRLWNSWKTFQNSLWEAWGSLWISGTIMCYAFKFKYGMNPPWFLQTWKLKGRGPLGRN